MLNIIDNLNNNCVPENVIFISFDVVNMFPTVYSESLINSDECLLSTRPILNSPTLCILEVLRLCLWCNNSILNNKFYLQTDGKAQDLICLILTVILLWQCMMRKQWNSHSNLWFRQVFVMMWLHYGFTTMNLQIIIWIIWTPLMHQVRLDSLKVIKKDKLKMNMAYEFLDIYEFFD